jgi:hypothetical protein
MKQELDALWSKRVRQRDKKCALCSKGKKLAAHHWVHAKSRSNLYRWDLHNGITLCFTCHIHYVHGTASWAAISRLSDYMIRNEYITVEYLSEMVKDRPPVKITSSFFEAVRKELEGDF